MPGRFTPHFYEMIRNPEKVKTMIRAAYAKHGTLQKAGESLGVSVAQLRVQCRKLGFNPVAEVKEQKMKKQQEQRMTRKDKSQT